MAFEEEISTEEFIPETGDPQPTLSADHRKRLDSIVVHLYSQKASEDDIRAVVDDYKKKYAVVEAPPSTPTIAQVKEPAFISTAPKTEPVVAATKQPGFFEEVQTQYGVPSSTALLPESKNYDKLQEKIKEASGKISQIAGGHDDVKGKIVRDRQQKQFVDELNLSQQDESYPKPDIRITPVTPEEITNENISIYTDQRSARHFLKEVGKQKPELKPEIEKSTYLLDAQQALGEDERTNARTPKVLKNAAEIEKGKYTYDVTNQHLMEPKGFFGSLVEGRKQMTSLLDDYDFFKSATKEEIISKLNDDLKSYDPLDPVIVPEGLTGIAGNFLGSNPIRSIVAGGVVSLAGLPEAAPFVAGIAGGVDMGQMKYASAFRRNYNEFKSQGLDDSEAYDRASESAVKEGLAAAATGAVMGTLGSRMGMKAEFPGFNVFKESVQKGLAQVGETTVKKTIEGLGVGGIGAGGTVIQNLIAKNAGLDRELDEGAKEQLGVGVMFTLGAALIAKAPQALSKKIRNNIVAGLAKADEAHVATELDNMKQNGLLTPEEATAAKTEIQEFKAVDQTIPDNVPELNRLKIGAKIKERAILEKQIENTDKAFHEDLKERVNKLNEEILELAKPEPKGELQKIVAKSGVEGSTAEVLKKASEEELNTYFKEIAQQAHDPATEQATIDTFGDKIVEKAKEMFPAKIKASDGQEYANTPRMRDLVKQGDEIRNSLPPPAEEQTRLWRGNRPGETGENPSFTNSLEGIALPFKEQYGGDLSFVDVPTSELGKYENKSGAAPGSEFILPPELAEKSITIKPEEHALPIGKSEETALDEASGNSPEMEPRIPQPEESSGTQEGGIPKEKGNAKGESEITGLPVEDAYGLPFIDEAGDKRTGIKNYVSKSTRFERTLPEVEVPKLGEDQEVVAQGKELVDSGKINPLDVVNRINATNEGMHPDEAKAMQYYMHQLDKHESNIREQLATTADPLEKAGLSGQLQQVADEIDAATTANIKSGKAWSDVGNIRQIVLDKGFNASRELAVIKDAYGGEIPAKAKLTIEKLTKERNAAIEERNKIEEKLKQAKAETVVKDIKDIVEKQEKKSGGKQKKQDILKERENLLEELKKAIKTDTSSGYAFPFPKATIDVLGRLAVNYFKEGYVTLEEIAAKVFEDVKGHFPGATKKDVRNALSLYDPLRVEAREKKIKSAEQKETRIENKLASGDVLEKKTNPFLEFQKDNEWTKANQRALNAEYKLKVQRRIALESQKNWYQKGLMWFGRLTRLSVLSGYNVLGKLASAATLGGAVKRIPEQAIAFIYGHAFRGISEKAPIEGFVSAKSEAKFYKEFFNPKKFVKNSWEILKSGSSLLSKKMGGAEYEHVPGLYLPTDLHQIIKDPLKRATFEASFRNAMVWAEKNGLDINDDLVIQSLETAAYKRAQYEIFQEKNWLSKKFGQFKSNMEKAGNLGATGKFLADFMIPVSTVPTNIVKRVASTSPLGLIRGSAKVINAYRKGIENLSHEEADSVMRQLKQGTLGTALWLIGWYGFKSFGGLYSKFDPNKKRQEGELESDMMQVAGEDIPKPVQHALPLEVIQMAATARRIYDNYRIDQGASTFEATEKAALGSIGALIEQVPVLETGVHAVEATSDPYMAKKLEEDVKRRFEPQILRETGIIPKEEKPPKQSGSNKRTTRTGNKRNKKVHR